MAAARPEGALVRVRVQPRASRDEIQDWQGDALRVRVTAPPVEGEANMAIRKLLAKALGVAPSTVEAVVAGLVLCLAVPAAADHLTLDPSARPIAPRPFDADVSVRAEDGGFHVGGRVFGFGQALGAWLRARVKDGGVTLDGQLKGDRAWNFRIDADPARPSLTIDVYPGTL